MEKLLWIGAPAFANSLGECGWNEVCVTPAISPWVSWDDLVGLAGFVPDAIIASASGDMAPLTGMEEFPCLTVFHTDSFREWHVAYSQGFDAALVSSFDQMPNFYAGMLHPENVWWSPPYARVKSSSAAGAPRQWDCLFLEDENSGGEAKTFGDRIGAELPGLRRGGPEQAGNARILLLHTAKNKLDAAVFDAMARGGCVVTPRVKDGLGKIFVDGEQLVAYAPGDAGDALYRIRFLLERPELLGHIASCGQEEIEASHRAIHRAMSLTDHLCDLWMASDVGALRPRQEAAADIREIFLKGVYQQMAETAPNKMWRVAFAKAAG